MRQAEREQNVAGVERAGGACRAGRCTDALCVQQKQQAFALYALKAHVDGAGDMMLERAVYLGMGDLAELGKELITHGDDLSGVGFHIVNAFLESRRQSNYAGDILGAGALAALLSAAFDDIKQRHTGLCIQNAYALGSVELMA